MWTLLLTDVDDVCKREGV